MTIKSAIFLLFLIVPMSLNAQFSVSGYIYDAKDKETLQGATIIDTLSLNGTATNAYGFFSFKVNKPNVILRISYIGFETQIFSFDTSQDSLLAIYLEEQTTEMQGVVISANRDELIQMVNSTKMSTLKLKPYELGQIPTFAGESDLLKIAQLMPGITQGNEGTTGIYVRGGTDDQNLIQLDDAVVYNVGHLLGFFSVFNSDALKDVEIIKGSFPAKYGGRLSSIMDIRMADGSLDRWNIKSGIGLLTSRMTIDGPIITDKMSFMIAGRRTYIDKVLKLLPGESLPYYFYDLNTKINYKLSERDRIYLSSYWGKDVLYNPDDSEDLGFGFNLGNVTSTLRWNHVYGGGNIFSNVTIHQTRFKYNIFIDDSDNLLDINSHIQDFGVKTDWEWFPYTKSTFGFGIGYVHHIFRPNVFNTSGDIADYVKSKSGPKLNTDEFHIYASNEYELSDKWLFTNGIRLSGVLGDTKYFGFEPRAALRYSLTASHSLKLGYSEMMQYMHRVSSGSFTLPTDLWYPVTDIIKPLHSIQLTIGYFGAAQKHDYSWSIELYTKTMDNLIDYKEGASLFFNDNFEKEFLSGEGRSHGIEFLLRKHQGKVSGWIGYTLSKTDRYFPELNNGKRYPDRYDRRHNLSAVGMLALASNINLSFSWLYMSGTHLTVQTGQFITSNASLTNVELIPIYSSKNAVELSATHRLDINLIFKGKQRSWGYSEWQLSIYNFYNRASPFTVSIGRNGDAYSYIQNGIFGVIPTLSWNINFSSK